MTQHRNRERTAMTFSLNPMRALLCFIIGVAVTGCGLFDSAVEWRGGPYALIWIDRPESLHIARDEGKGAWTPRIAEQVLRSAGTDAI
jgi:hypothetical protein